MLIMIKKNIWENSKLILPSLGSIKRCISFKTLAQILKNLKKNVSKFLLLLLDPCLPFWQIFIIFAVNSDYCKFSIWNFSLRMSLESLSSGYKGHARESKGIKNFNGIIFQTKIINPKEYIAFFIRNGNHLFCILIAH